MTQPHTVHSFSTLPHTPTPSLPPTYLCKLHPPLSQDIIIAPVSPYSAPIPPPPPPPPTHTHTHTPIPPYTHPSSHKPSLLGEHIPSHHQYHPTLSTIPPPPPPPHTHTIHCANQHPASTTHIWLTPIPNHPVTQPSLTSKSIYNHPTHCKPSPSEHIPSHHHYHPILSTPITAPTLHPHRPLHTHTIHWPNQHPASTTHTLWLTPIPQPSSDPITSHHYQNIVIQLIAHPASVNTYQVIIQIIQLCQQSPDLTTSSTNLVSTTPSQHHPHPANTLIPPHSPTGLDISGNYSLPTFFRNFTFFNIEYINGLVQTAVSPLLVHWRYCTLALNHLYLI